MSSTTYTLGTFSIAGNDGYTKNNACAEEKLGCFVTGTLLPFDSKIVYD